MFVETKPNPEIYNYTINSMNLFKRGIVVIEDSNYGIEAAKAAGLKVGALIYSTFGFALDSADYKIQSLKDVIKIIEDLEREYQSAPIKMRVRIKYSKRLLLEIP